MKWLSRVLYVILMIILSPIILLILICYGIALPFMAISRRISYKKSAYYKDFKIPYKKRIYDSYGYVFYNCAKEMNLPIEYIIQKSNSFEYFIYNQQVFIFPDCNGIEYNEDTKCYDVIYWKHYNNKTTRPLDDYLKEKISLFENKPDLPIKLLVSRDFIKEKYIDLSSLPESLFVIRNYYSCFNEEYNENLSLIPSTTEELYNMMKNNDKLGGSFELENIDQIIWTFDDVVYDISVNGDDGIIRVCKNNSFKSEITHWHPESYEIYYDICNIGEKGNIIVIKLLLGASKILYMGKKDKCSYTKKRFLLGKHYFFESK